MNCLLTALKVFKNWIFIKGASFGVRETCEVNSAPFQSQHLLGYFCTTYVAILRQFLIGADSAESYCPTRSVEFPFECDHLIHENTMNSMQTYEDFDAFAHLYNVDIFGFAWCKKF